MKHPFDALRSEYEANLASMRVRAGLVGNLSRTVDRLLRFVAEGKYGDVADQTGIPLAFIAPSFEREASSDFRKSPAQGDRWDRTSIHVPAGRGPFDSWRASAFDAYHLNGLDAVGHANWNGALLCYYGELFNGFGYRDYHRMRSPYLWGWTNLQQPGKYTSDGHFEAGEMDGQPGIVPLAFEMIRRLPALAVTGIDPLAPALPIPTAPPHKSPLAGARGHDVKWLQGALNKVLDLDEPLLADGSYGKKTRAAVLEYQRRAGITVDGLAGDETYGALEADLAKVAT